METTAAIVVAAGAGTRMGAGTPKALMPLAGRPLVSWAVEAVARAAAVGAVVVAGPPGRLDEMAAALGPAAGAVALVPGGASRAASVAEALRAVPEGAARVVVHDAARPLAAPGLVAAVLEALEGVEGAIAASPVPDTLKRAGPGLIVDGTVDRSELWRAETPQAFWTEALRAAVAAARGAGRLDAATDCASLVEAAGGRVRLVPSGEPNPKVTTPADVPVVEALIAASRS
jgi:2-C-methyl-D-erythritol 4-phosphate cytidylyltransferase